MTDNPADDNLDLDDGSFDNVEKKKNTLGDLWRENPMFKVSMVIAAAVLIFGTIVLFGSGEQPAAPSVVPEGQDVSAPPGTEGASPAYIEAVREQNERRVEVAEQTGTSALPTPIETPVGRLTIPDEQAGGEDPLQRWRKLQEERIERELQKTQNLAPTAQPQDANRQEAIQRLSEAMATQMQAILDSRGNVKVSSKSVNDISWLEGIKNQEMEAAQRQVQQQAQESAAALDPDPDVILMPAGEIAYGITITEANSDARAPVLAQIAGGPLNGSRILGSFETTDNDLLTINFDTIIVDGISYDIEAIAIDPETTLPAMATDVDHHYLKRIVLPVAASFVTGLANAITESGSTTISINSSTGTSTATEEGDKDDKQEVSAGIDKAGQAMEEILNEIKDETKVTIVIKRGTRIGILFTEPVIESNTKIRSNVNSQANQPLPFNGQGFAFAPAGSFANVPQVPATTQP